MELPDFIKSVGLDKAAELFEISPRTVQGWMYRKRYPRRETAQLIVERTKGVVPMEGIYGRQP